MLKKHENKPAISKELQDTVKGKDSDDSLKCLNCWQCEEKRPAEFTNEKGTFDKVRNKKANVLVVTKKTITDLKHFGCA